MANDDDKIKKHVEELRQHFRKLLFPEIIEILEERNNYYETTFTFQKDRKVQKIMIEENNKTIETIKKIIDGKD